MLKSHTSKFVAIRRRIYINLIAPRTNQCHGAIFLMRGGSRPFRTWIRHRDFIYEVLNDKSLSSASKRDYVCQVFAKG